MLHRTAIPLVTQFAASCLAPGDAAVLRIKIDIFCHLPKFFLTPAKSRTLPEKRPAGRRFPPLAPGGAPCYNYS